MDLSSTIRGTGGSGVETLESQRLSAVTRTTESVLFLETVTPTGRSWDSRPTVRVRAGRGKETVRATSKTTLSEKPRNIRLLNSYPSVYKLSVLSVLCSLRCRSPTLDKRCPTVQGRTLQNPQETREEGPSPISWRRKPFSPSPSERFSVEDKRVLNMEGWIEDPGPWRSFPLNRFFRCFRYLISHW